MKRKNDDFDDLIGEKRPEPGDIDYRFWAALVGILAVNIACFAVPVAIPLVVIVDLVVGLRLLRDQNVFGPHRTLAQAMVVTGVGMAAAFAFIFVVGMGGPTFRLYSSTGGVMLGEPYIYGPTAISQPLLTTTPLAPENTTEAGPPLDPIILEMTQTILAATNAVGSDPEPTPHPLVWDITAAVLTATGAALEQTATAEAP